MGLGPLLLHDLLDLKRQGAIPQQPSVVEIGAQQLSNALLRDTDAIRACFAAFGRPVPDFPTPGARVDVDGIEVQPANAPAADMLWQGLGFTYACVDYGGHRNSIPIDLNSDSVPSDLRGRFDLVVNSGTTEHVANQANAFKVMHDLAAPAGGVNYHELPAGAVDHGLISYTPNFFTLLQRQNDYEQLICRPRTETDMTIRVAFRRRDGRDFNTPLDIRSKRFRLKHKPAMLALRRLFS